MAGNDFMGSVRNNWRQRATEKTTLKDELRVVPRWLFRAVVALYVVALASTEAVNFAGVKTPFSDFGPILSGLALAGMVTLCSAVVAPLIFLFGYIYADARRRGMNGGLWLILSIFVPYLIGVIIYFVVREPLPFNCPQCGAKVTAHFNYCPRCQYNLRPNCPQCRREVRPGDRFCPHCGAAIEPAASIQPVQAAGTPQL